MNHDDIERLSFQDAGIGDLKMKPGSEARIQLSNLDFSSKTDSTRYQADGELVLSGVRGLHLSRFFNKCDSIMDVVVRAADPSDDAVAEAEILRGVSCSAFSVEFSCGSILSVECEGAKLELSNERPWLSAKEAATTKKKA